MKLIKTKLEGVVILEPVVFGDHRGFFMESWSKQALEELGLHYDFVQDNHSKSTTKGTLRGIHFQKGDKAQAKLVRCVKGAVLDVAVDLRHDTKTFWIINIVPKNSRTFGVLCSSFQMPCQSCTIENIITKYHCTTIASNEFFP